MDERNISYGWIDECQEARRERFWDVRDILRDLPAHVLESWAEHGEMPRPTMPVTLSREHATALWLKRETVWGDELIAQVLSDVRTRYIEYFAPILHLAPTAWLDFMRLSHAGAILSDHRARIA